MGLCIKTPFGGTLLITGCSQAWIDANLRIKPEVGSTLTNAHPGEQDIDGVYWGGQYAREVWKVPDNCRLEITCDGDSVTFRTCHNLLTLLFGYELKVFAPRSVPDAS